MKSPVLLHKNTKSGRSSFLLRHAHVPHLYNRWHYHEELELLYVVRGDGTRYVGDSIEPFFDEDMVLVGSNVPHLWQSDRRYFRGDPGVTSEAILLQFVPDLFGDVFNLPECGNLKGLIVRARRGLQFSAPTRRAAAGRLRELLTAEGPGRISRLLDLLECLAQDEASRPLATTDYRHSSSNLSDERLQQVLDHLITHFQRPITLEEVARVANMSEKAFCRFFKRVTRKTFVQFVTELRLSHACKLLLSTKRPIGEVCAAAGFNNLSHFNRVFRRSLGYTPREYRRAFANL